MKNRKLWVSLLAGFMAALMLFGLIAAILPTPASAEKSSAEIKQEINQMKDKLKENQSQVAELEGKLSDNMDKMEDIVAQKDLIDQQVFLLNEQIQYLSQQITSYSELIADKQDELDAATARWQELNDKYKARIRAMEKNGKISYWSVLFKANSFSDFLDRVNMVEEIAAADQRRLSELNEAATAVRTAKEGLESEKESLQASKAEQEEASAKLIASREEADQLLKQLIATGDEYQRLLDEAEKRESEAAATIDKLEYAYDAAKVREYQQWLATQKPSSGGASNIVDGNVWLIPINYNSVSSPFGYRWHPVYGDWRFHYGVDLTAPQGTPIVASRGGQVTTTDYEAGGAGYYVRINHLDGFSTVYMHMTHYIVSPGQYVAAGQVIGYCGSTGASTGPHLHFGVYYNGSAVNPAQYINVS